MHNPTHAKVEPPLIRRFHFLCIRETVLPGQESFFFTGTQTSQW